MSEENPYKGITKEEIKEAVQEVFRSDRVVNHDRWYRNLSKQQREVVDKIFKEEVQRQLAECKSEETREFKIKTVGQVCKETEIAEGLRSVNPDKIKGGKPSPFIHDEVGQFNIEPWWENPESETYKQWTEIRNKMNKKNKKYKQ